MEKRETIAQFCKRTDFIAKFRARLEDIENGQDFGAFEGLQTDGVAGVLVFFDCNTVRLGSASRMLETMLLNEREARMREEAQVLETQQPKEPSKVERKKTK